jgi:hypothetical protein
MSSSVTPAELSSAGSAQKGPRLFIPRLVPGLRGRLLLAFFAISLFVITAATAGLYALGKVGRTLDGITLKTVPAALDARELWRKSEKIIGVGPALVNASDSKAAEALTSRVRGEMADVSAIPCSQRRRGFRRVRDCYVSDDAVVRCCVPRRDADDITSGRGKHGCPASGHP